MERPRFEGTDDLLTDQIIGVFYQVHKELGYGFLEAIYRRAMAIALKQAGLAAEEEVAVPVFFRGEDVGCYRADLLVERRILLELKTAEAITKAHEAQLTHYLYSSKIELGLILNFGEQARVRRIEFKNDRKRQSQGSVLVPPLSVLS